jgi:hypothetical protein
MEGVLGVASLQAGMLSFSCSKFPSRVNGRFSCLKYCDLRILGHIYILICKDSS